MKCDLKGCQINPSGFILRISISPLGFFFFSFFSIVAGYVGLRKEDNKKQKKILFRGGVDDDEDGHSHGASLDFHCSGVLGVFLHAGLWGNRRNVWGLVNFI